MDREIENINDLMQALTKLPKDEFNASVLAMAVLTINTLREENGVEFIEGFMHGAINEKGPMATLKWKGPEH